MNFSKVRVQGVLKSDARMLRGGAALYLIADESGSLPVFLTHAPEGKLPQAGCHMVATGRLNVGTGNQLRMRVRNAGQIVVEEAAPSIVVHGQVSEVWFPPKDSKAPHKISLITPDGSLEIIHWFIPEREVEAGDLLEVSGTLGFYKGRKQLKVRKPSDIRLQSEG